MSRPPTDIPIEGNGRPRRPYRLMIIGGLVVTGVALHHLGVFDWYRLLDVAEAHARSWWFPPAVVVVKAGMYTFALPGAVMFWIPGLVYSPLAATGLLVAGGVLGGLAAYVFARSTAVEFAPGGRSARLFAFFRGHTDLATLTAMRALPGFPHSILNYGSGLLGVPIGRFVASTTVGFTVKAYLYSTAIHRTATAADPAEIASAETLLPLIGLALLFAAGRLFSRRYTPE